MAKRVGVRLGTAGGASNAVERAHEIGANAFPIFSSSPCMWRAPKIDRKQAERNAPPPPFEYNSGKSTGGCLEDASDRGDGSVCGFGRRGFLAIHSFSYGAAPSSRGNFACIGDQDAGQV